MFKLLSKNEIDKAKNLDKAREIAEGLKISRRVDALRNLQANEEKSLEDFKVQTLSAIQAEISGLVFSKETLIEEIRVLRSEKERGLKEVEVKKKNLDILADSLDEKEDNLIAKSIELFRKEGQISKNLKVSEDELLRRKTHTEEAHRLHRKAEKEKQEADLILIKTQEVQEKALKKKEEMNIVLLMREKIIDEREKILEQEKETTKQIMEDLAIEKIQLVDQRATLERAMKRLQK